MRFLASFLLLLLCISFFSAHTCITYKRLDKEHKKQLQKISAIFYGEVVSISEKRYGEYEQRHGTQILKVRVIRAWKGVETSEIFVAYNRAYTSFEEEYGGIGVKKMFYADMSQDGVMLRVEYCSFSLFDDEKMKLEYGEGKTFEQATPQASSQIEQEADSKNFFLWLWDQISSIFT